MLRSNAAPGLPVISLATKPRLRTNVANAITVHSANRARGKPDSVSSWARNSQPNAAAPNKIMTPTRCRARVMAKRSVTAVSSAVRPTHLELAFHFRTIGESKRHAHLAARFHLSRRLHAHQMIAAGRKFERATGRHVDGVDIGHARHAAHRLRLVQHQHAAGGRGCRAQG